MSESFDADKTNALMNEYATARERQTFTGTFEEFVAIAELGMTQSDEGQRPASSELLDGELIRTYLQSN